MRNTLEAAICLILALLFGVSPVEAYTEEELYLEFDARNLSAAEKRFLQAGLALSGTYNAMLDGAWGAGSQRALERYAVQNEIFGPVPNWLATLLAVQTLDQFEKDGWEERHLETLDISLLVPTKKIRDAGTSGSFANLNHTETSLAYSLTRGDASQVGRLHAYTLDQAVAGTTPYEVRRSDVWITSARTGPGNSLYTRSDLRGRLWSTVMLSASDADGGQLAAVSGSIRPGSAPPVFLPPGKLTSGVSALVAVLEDEPEHSSKRPSAMLPDGRPPATNGSQSSGGSGTGFVVSPDGLVLTNYHVAGECQLIEVDDHPAKLIAADEGFDLALLAVEGASGWASAVFADNPARLNSDVTIAGYPYAGLLGGLNVTRGTVASLKGLGGDVSEMQISAPVQPGNSGGPVVDAAGNVVGVVVAKLNAQVVADAFGDIPQNVNFAIRGEIAKLFLFQNGVEPREADEAPGMNPVDLAEKVQGFTRFITCY
ncbi:serine protease [Tropicimonas sp. IMCC6043]|uniref:S1 family peptidase n=1 Tax=Tropicimonas sp. IMCC6043 TaxID=2510645 RepID=UPI0013EB4114|nr:serine protease [Tropicimonas sp. IMCC6043]